MSTNTPINPVPSSPMPAWVRAPQALTGHAVMRFRVRWGAGPSYADAETELQNCLSRVRFVEAVADERQSIWAYDRPNETFPVLLVVDTGGTVRTVLPAGSQRPASRGPA